MPVFAESSPIWPAIWSAIAATSSAIAAITLMTIHIKNREDSVRPELILEDWGFTDDPHGLGSITIGKIRNEGRGPVLHMRGQLEIPGAKPIFEGGPFAGFFHDPVPFLGVGKDLQVNWSAKFKWQGSSISSQDIAFTPLHLTLFVTDIHGRLHETIYEMVAFKSMIFAGATTLAPGLALSRRYTTITPWWKLRFRSRRQRIMDAVNRSKKSIQQLQIYKDFQDHVKNRS
jgi:hypothetical protein